MDPELHLANYEVFNEFALSKYNIQQQQIAKNCPVQTSEKTTDPKSPNFFDEFYQPDTSDAQMLRDELKEYKEYKLACKKAECDNLDKISMLWSYKKVFTVPWLIAFDKIFS